jgi:O-antigen/teichoic acid export membrane protein
MTTTLGRNAGLIRPALSRLRPLFVNFGLQGLNLASKALLAFLLARCLPVAEVGVFGLMVSTLSLSLVAVGLDFTNFSMREILRHDRAEVPRLLRDQLVLHLLTYLVFGPPLALVFVAGVLPWALLGWFYAVLVLDHLAQELQRLLVILNWPSRATLLLFLRQGAWVYGLIALFLAESDLAALHTVFATWAAGELAAILLAAYWLRGLNWRGAARRPVDWAWLGRGLGVALPFLVSTLSYTAIGVTDRFTVQHFWGLELTGVYTFYLYVRSAIQSLLEVGVGLAYQPRVLVAFQNGRLDEYRRLMREFKAIALGLGLLMAAAAAVLIGPVVSLTGQPIYGEHLTTFWVVLALPLVALFVNIVQLDLYARHRDRCIVAGSASGLAASVLFNLLLVPPLGILGAALATLAALGTIALLSLAFLRYPASGGHS